MRGIFLGSLAMLTSWLPNGLAGQTIDGRVSDKSSVQNSPLQVNFLSRGIDDEMMHLLDVLPLFELSNADLSVLADASVSVKCHQPIDMSADYPGMKLSQYSVKLPKQLFLRDSSGQGVSVHLKSNLVYGFAQHNHGVGLLPNHTLLVVERPQAMKYRKARVWVDLNHNLDLTDDPEQYYTPSSVPFSSPVIPELGSVIQLDGQPWGVSLQLGFFGGGELKSYQKLYADAVDLVKGDRKFIGVSNSFRQRRLSVVWGSSVYNNDTLYWALKDANLNGKYNDEAVDMVMVSNESGVFNSANAWKLGRGKTVLDWLGQGWEIRVGYKFTDLDQPHWRVDASPIPGKKVKNSRSLLLGNRFPKFRFCVIEGAYKAGKLKENPVHRRSIRKFKGKYTAVLVWNADDSVFHKDSAIYHEISRQLPDSMQIIMLNHGGSGRYVYGYNRRYETNMIHGFCSPQVAEILKLQTMPQLFFLDPKQRLIDINMAPYELQKRMNGTLR